MSGRRQLSLSGAGLASGLRAGRLDPAGTAGIAYDSTPFRSDERAHIGTIPSCGSLARQSAGERC